jgi:hypothetical protein
LQYNETIGDFPALLQRVAFPGLREHLFRATAKMANAFAFQAAKARS